MLKYASLKWLEKQLNGQDWRKFEICCWQMVGKALKVSIMVGGSFEICWLQMTRKGLIIVHRGWRKF